MARAARYVPENGYLHVMCRGNNRRKVFLKPKDYKFYLWLAGKFKLEEAVKIIHYCLMPNHAHFLLGVMPESNLASFMKRLNLIYFFNYRKRRDYVGHLWQGRYKGKIIEKDDYFIGCGKYIELNPVRAGLCDQPEEYPYSSYMYYAYGKEDDLLDEDPFYAGFGATAQERQAVYRRIVSDEDVARKMSFRKFMNDKELEDEGASLL